MGEYLFKLSQIKGGLKLNFKFSHISCKGNKEIQENLEKEDNLRKLQKLREGLFKFSNSNFFSKKYKNIFFVLWVVQYH